MSGPRKVIMCLGRNGDIVNSLPLVLREHKEGRNPILCVSRDFQDVLDGVGYCERLVYPGPYNDPSAAARWLQPQFPGNPIAIAQHYRNPLDRKRETNSYQTESWRCAGALEEFGKYPLVFDRRNPDRERAISNYFVTEGEPHILVSMDSVSSPFSRREDAMSAISRAAKDCWIYDISKLRAERIYDLIGLYDRSTCLISVDTVHLHLARAAKVPVIAITNNGFFGSVPPPGSVANIRYGDPDLIEKLETAVNFVRDADRNHRFVIHAVDMFEQGERGSRAQATWPEGFGDESIIECYGTDWGDDSKAIGDPRSLPFLKAILKKALSRSTSDSDVVLFQNSDVGLTPGSVDVMRRHAALFGAFSMRRREPHETYIHVGRDLFGFSADWLQRNLDKIPDFYVGAPYFDLVLAAIIRKERGVITTPENLAIDFYPCDMEPGSATHEAHFPYWAGENQYTLPANVHNRTLAARWAQENCPSLAI